MRVLLFDTENGSKSLGSKEKIQENFGYPVLRPTSWNGFNALLGQIYKQEIVQSEVSIGELKVKENRTVLIPKNGTDVGCIVLDTYTELVKKHQRELKGNSKTLSLPGWGELKNDIDMSLEIANKLPCNVVFNVHGKIIEDRDLGVLKLIPNIEGSSKDDLGKWFDFVFYAITSTDDKGNHIYSWITKRSERYDHAKDRTNLLPDTMPQDYGMVLDAAEKSGWDSAKILVIGSPGSGKTFALKTLTKGEK